MKTFYYLRICIIISFALFITSCSKKETKNTKEGTGLQFTDTSILHKVIKAKPPMIGGSSKLPASVDLSPKMPPPGNQGSQNSCVGWSIAYGMKSYQEKVARNWDILQGDNINNAHVFSPAFIYNQINNGQDNGSRFTDAFSIVQQKGVASLSKDPYDQNDFTSKPNDEAVSEAQSYRIAWAKTIDPSNIEGIKSYLSKGYPVIIAVAFDEEFMNPNGPATVTSMQVDNTSMGHAMVIVGYDDNNKVFKIMNSWGTSWREGGFCYFTYDVFTKCIRECWVAKDEEDKKEIKKEDEQNINGNTTVTDEILSGLVIRDYENGRENPDDPQAGKCLKINGTVKLDNNYGDRAVIVVFLNYDDGKPVKAADEKYAYYDGGVGGFTQPIDITSYNEQTKEFSIYIPYSAMKVEEGKPVAATPYLFIDDFDATDGNPVAVKISE